MPFYAVANGRNIGIYTNWDECNSSVKGYKHAIYKKFNTKEEAEEFIQINRKNIDGAADKKEETGNQEKGNQEKGNQEKGNQEKGNQTESIFTPHYYVYTDGACSNNGKQNASAGIGIFFGIDDHRNISKKIEGKQTNNAAELSAIIETYPIIENDVIHGKNIAIVTDSEYAIKCVSSYGEKCCKKEWTVDIPNKELVKTVYELYKDKPNIRFIHVKAHTQNTDAHSFGNANADTLANSAIGLEVCPYNNHTI